VVSGVIVDSNILIDIATADPVWGPWSLEKLEEFSDLGPLIINPVIYGEVSVSFNSIEELEERLPLSAVQREAIPFEAAFLAGKVFAAYRRRGGDRASLLPDFLIGAHAAIKGYAILTRDDRRYRAHFPRIRLITPRLKN